MLTPMEVEEDADILGGAGEHSQWCGIVKGGAGGVVEKEGSAFESKQPQQRGGVSPIHQSVGSLFDVLTSAFCRVLVLMMCLRLPIFNEQMTQDIMHLVADLHLSTVANQFGRSSLSSNDIL